MVDEDLIDRILAAGPTPLFKGDVHVLMAIRLEGILSSLVEGRTLSRWDVRTELNRAISLFTRGAPQLSTVLERVVDKLSREPIVESLRESVLETLLRGKHNYTALEYPAVRGFARPVLLISCIDDNLRALGNIITQASAPLSQLSEPIAHDVNEMKAIVDAWTAQLDGRAEEPFRLAALDVYAEDKTRFRWPLQFDRTDSSVCRFVERIEISLRAIEQIVAHLQHLIEEFDRLDPKSPDLNEQIAWSNKCTAALGRDARKHLIPYLRNRKHGGPAPDTVLIRQIAELYQSIYGQRFRINGAETNDSYKRAASRIRNKLAATSETATLRSQDLVQYKVGASMKFACAIVNGLGLHSILFPFTEHELGFDPLIHGEGDRPTDEDVKNYNRSLGPVLRAGISRVALVNKIGDIWKRDEKRSAAND